MRSTGERKGKIKPKNTEKSKQEVRFLLDPPDYTGRRARQNSDGDMAVLALGVCLSGILWKAVLFVFVLLLEGMAFYNYKYSTNVFY